MTPGTEPTKSILTVLLLVGGEARSVISLQSIDEENAFDEGDVRLLTTLAATMGVAWKTPASSTRPAPPAGDPAARHRAGDHQQCPPSPGSKLDTQKIYELVGDKVRDVLDAHAAVGRH